MQAITEVEF